MWMLSRASSDMAADPINRPGGGRERRDGEDQSAGQAGLQDALSGQLGEPVEVHGPGPGGLLAPCGGGAGAGPRAAGGLAPTGVRAERSPKASGARRAARMS